MKVLLVSRSYEDSAVLHLLLNALDMQEKGFEVKIMFEEAATKYIAELNEDQKPFSGLYKKARGLKLIDAVCQACAKMTGVLEAAQEQDLPIVGDMKGHPSLAKYLQEGYQVLIY